VEASVEGPTIAGFLQAAILLGTAGIVWWYTKETQRLRETAQQQVEVQQRPLIIIEPQFSEGALSLLIVRNVGNSAAINVTVVKDASTVRISLLTPGSGTSVRIETDTEAISQILRSRAASRALREEGLLSHDQALFIDHDMIAHGPIRGPRTKRAKFQLWATKH
jgi:hypothetical protein